ncbi:hypothetical protein ACHAWU_010254 [Discostella pseudostelligera]|uniref:Peptidase M41 domain-containing protein n=1 Tax=Discostella pseudostelligera TaxID=259834 RepID=A0ABD3NAC5_9STRA
MTFCRRPYLLVYCVGATATTAFTGSSRKTHVPAKISKRHPLAPFSPSTFRQTTYLRFKPEVDDAITTSIEVTNGGGDNNDALSQALESNSLEKILSYLQSHPTFIPHLTKSQIQTIFDTIELATAESEDNTVNKRALQDANLVSAAAAGSGGIEFRSLDRVRSQMTQLYRLLREHGRLNIFGAIGRPPPSCIELSSPPPGGPVYPTSGSKIITPALLEEITNMEMINLTPRPTNLLLYGGVALALLEGLASLYFDISFNLIVVCSILLALMDQILVSGAVFETALRMIRPEMTSRITKHEAGHFLCAYILGCPVEGVVLSKWAALNDGRFGRRSSVVSAGTSYYDLDLSEQIAGVKPLTRESIDRYSIIVMGGIAAEALGFGRADGGAGDEEALVRFLSSLNPRSKSAVSAWTPDLIRNQARWGATQAVLLLREYKPCYDALVDALERGGDLGQCIAAIEEAGATAGLSWLSKPLGKILDEGEFGKWIPINEASLTDGVDMIGSNGDLSESHHATTDSMEKTNGVPTYGDDPITSTEEFLRKYRDVMERKLASLDEKLEELEAKD